MTQTSTKVPILKATFFVVILGFVGILFFTAAFNFGFGSMVWVYASESFPAQLRTLGSSTMLTADLVANVIIASFFLSALTSLGGMVTFIILVVFAVIAWLALGVSRSELNWEVA